MVSDAGCSDDGLGENEEAEAEDDDDEGCGGDDDDEDDDGEELSKEAEVAGREGRDR